MLSCLPWLPATFPSGAAPAGNKHTAQIQQAGPRQLSKVPDVRTPSRMCISPRCCACKMSGSCLDWSQIPRTYLARST